MLEASCLAAASRRLIRRLGQDSLAAFALRFLLIALCVGGLALWQAQPLTRALLPLFEREINWLDDSYRIDRLGLARDGAEDVIRIDVGLVHAITLNGQILQPDPRGTAMASTLVGNVTLPMILMIAVAMAWPARTRSAFGQRALLLLPTLLLLWMLDVPMILWASLWTLHVQAFDPQRVSPLLLWSHFLHGGGRLALAAALGVLVAGSTARDA